MTLTPEQAERRAAIAELYAFGSGEITMEAIGAALNPPISKARVSQIIKAAKRDAQRERCARGEHGERTESTYTAWVHGRGPTRVSSVRCEDCGAEIER